MAHRRLVRDNISVESFQIFSETFRFESHTPPAVAAVAAAAAAGIFMQGNDHSLRGSDVHDAARQCSDCGAFYMGREWTYRGNEVRKRTFAPLYAKNDHFTKTGSGQTQGKLKKRCVF
jgi:hypothetical protein